MPIADARDIIVTTPKKEMIAAAEEARNLIKHGSGIYFRRLSSKPLHIDTGSKVFYVEDGYIRGFAVICNYEERSDGRCSDLGEYYKPGFFIEMWVKSWKWIKPIPMKGFQGYRYFTPPEDMEIVGDWKDSKPPVKGEKGDTT